MKSSKFTIWLLSLIEQNCGLPNSVCGLLKFSTRLLQLYLNPAMVTQKQKQALVACHKNPHEMTAGRILHALTALIRAAVNDSN